MQERGTPAGNLKVCKVNTTDENRPVASEAVFLCPKGERDMTVNVLGREYNICTRPRG